MHEKQGTKAKHQNDYRSRGKIHNDRNSNSKTFTPDAARKIKGDSNSKTFTPDATRKIKGDSNSKTFIPDAARKIKGGL